MPQVQAELPQVAEALAICVCQAGHCNEPTGKPEDGKEHGRWAIWGVDPSSVVCWWRAPATVTIARAVSLPRISIVTPSFNQGSFLEATIRSVLDQDYPNLEYVIVDGGSTDNSIQIIKKYAHKLTWWVSERDGGQYEALNKGFAQTTGEIMAWLNSDDKYLPWTFATLADILTSLPEVEWLTSVLHLFWDEAGRAVSCEEHPGFSRDLILSGGTLPGCGWPAWSFVQQESTFWRRSLWQKAGCHLDPRWSLAGDFELWLRFAAHAELFSVPTPLAGFRRHGNQKTSGNMDEYIRQAKEAFALRGGSAPPPLKGWWLKSSGKLVRFLQRQHARIARQQGSLNRCVFDTQDQRWHLRRR